MYVLGKEWGRGRWAGMERESVILYGIKGVM